jgi:hypothetical protein
MAFTAPGKCWLRCRRDNRKVSHDHQDVAIIMEPRLQQGHAVNLHAMSCEGNSDSNRRALAAHARPDGTAPVCPQSVIVR